MIGLCSMYCLNLAQFGSLSFDNYCLIGPLQKRAKMWRIVGILGGFLGFWLLVLAEIDSDKFENVYVRFALVHTAH